MNNLHTGILYIFKTQTELIWISQIKLFWSLKLNKSHPKSNRFQTFVRQFLETRLICFQISDFLLTLFIWLLQRLNNPLSVKKRGRLPILYHCSSAFLLVMCTKSNCPKLSERWNRKWSLISDCVIGRVSRKEMWIVL